MNTFHESDAELAKAEHDEIMEVLLHWIIIGLAGAILVMVGSWIAG